MKFGPVKMATLASRAGEAAESVLDSYKASAAGLWALFDTAVTSGDKNGGALLAGRLHENFAAVARLTGEIMSSPLIQNNTVINNVSLRENAQINQLMADLTRVLQHHPDALRDVITEFDRLESTPELPALEHANNQDAEQALEHGQDTQPTNH